MLQPSAAPSGSPRQRLAGQPSWIQLRPRPGTACGSRVDACDNRTQPPGRRGPGRGYLQ